MIYSRCLVYPLSDELPINHLVETERRDAHRLWFPAVCFI